MGTLIASSDPDWLGDVRLVAGVETITSGADALVKLGQGNFSQFVLDSENQCPLFELIKSVKLNLPRVKVILVGIEKLKFDEPQKSEFFTKLGVNKVFPGKVLADVLAYIASLGQVSEPREPRETPALHSAYIPDHKITRIFLSDFISGNVSIFDYYLRTGPNQYAKIVAKGEVVSLHRLNECREAGFEHLYFLTEERTAYIALMNKLGDKLVAERKPLQAVKLASQVTGQLVDEIYTKGLSPESMDEALKLSRSMHELIRKDPSLNSVLDAYREQSPDGYNHLFLVSFFSIIICKHLPWAGPKTYEIVSLGALLHDIGLLKLPVELQGKTPETLSKEQLAIFQTHPLLGYKMLTASALVNEQVRQIVYQHHELVSGSGYPNGLSGIRTYPLSKIISLADAFSDVLMTQNLAPIEGLKQFLNNRERLMEYDASIIKALVSGFTPKRQRS